MGDITTLSIVSGTISESTVHLTSESSSLNVAEIKHDFGLDGSTSGDVETMRTMVALTDTVTSSTGAWSMTTESTVSYSSYGRDVFESSLFPMQHATQELPGNTGHAISLESSQYSTVFLNNQGQTLESQMLPSSVIFNHDSTPVINTVTFAMDNLPKSISELMQFSSGVMSQSHTEPLLSNSNNQDRPSVKQTPSVLKLDTLLSTGNLFTSFEQESAYKTNVPIEYLPTISSSHASLDNVSFTESPQTFQTVPSRVSDKLNLPLVSLLDYPTARAPYSTYTEASLIVVDSVQLNSTVAPVIPPMNPSSTKGEATILGGGLSDYYLYVGLPLCGVAVLFFLILCIICIRRQRKTRSKGSPAKHHVPDLWVHSQGETPLITKDSVPEANGGEALMIQRDLGCATYKAVFDFSGEQSSHLSLKEGDQVKVHRKEANGWWQGTVEDRTGWFPNDCVQAASHDEVVTENEVETPNDTQISSFMIKRNDTPTNSPTYPTEDNIKAEHTCCKVRPKRKSETKNSECSSSPTKSESSVQSVPQPFSSTLPDEFTKFVALYSHAAQCTGQLSFNKGDIFLCADHDLHGWTHGYNEATQMEGWVPSLYIEKIIDQPSTNSIPSPVSVSTITQSSSGSLVPADNIPVGAVVPAQDPPASDTLSKASPQLAQQPQPKSNLKPSRIAPVPPSKVKSTVESKLPTLSNRTPKLARPIVLPPPPPTINVKHADGMTPNKDGERNENRHTNQIMIVNDANASDGALQDLNQQPDDTDSDLVVKRGMAKPYVPNSYLKPDLVSIPKHEIKMPNVEAGHSDLARYRPPPPKPMTPKLEAIRVKLHAPEPLEDQPPSEDETVFQVTPQRKFATLMKQESEPESPVAVCRDLSSFGSASGKHQDHPAMLENDNDVDFNIPAKDAGSDSKNLVKMPSDIVNNDDDITKIENIYKVERQNSEKDISDNSNEIVSNISASLVKSSKLHPPKSVTAKLSAVSVISADTVPSGSALLAADPSSDKSSKLPRSHTDSGSKYPLSKVDGTQTQTKEGILQCASESAGSPNEERNPDNTNVSNVKEIAGEFPKNVESHSGDVDSKQATGKPQIAPKPKSGLPKLRLKLKPGAPTRETDVRSPIAESNTNIHSPCLPLSLASEKTESAHELNAKSDIEKLEVSTTPLGSAVMPHSPKHFGRKSQIPSNRMKNKSTNKVDYYETNNNKLSESDGDLLVSSKTNLTNETAESPTLSKMPSRKPVDTFVRQRSNSPANRTGIPLSVRNRSSSPSLPVANCTPALRSEDPASRANSTTVKTTNKPSGLVPPKKIGIEQEELLQHPLNEVLSRQNIDDLGAEHQKLDRLSKLPKVHKDQSKEGKPLKRGRSLLPVVHKMLDTGAASSNGADLGNAATKLESAIPIAKHARSQLTQQMALMANDDNSIDEKTTHVQAIHGLSAPCDSAV